MLWLGGELRLEFAGMIQGMAAAVGFCAVKRGRAAFYDRADQEIIGIWSGVIFTNFTGFALFTIGSGNDICQFLHCSDLAGPRPARSLQMAW